MEDDQGELRRDGEGNLERLGYGMLAVLTSLSRPDQVVLCVYQLCSRR